MRPSRGRNLVAMPHLVVIGGGPAGNTCASVAATLGAEVTVIERDVDRWCRAPVGLHPVEGVDRDRRRARGARRGRTRWGSRPRAASTSTRCASGSRRSRAALQQSIDESARVAGRAGDPRHRAARRARTRWSSTRRRGRSRRSKPTSCSSPTGSRPRVPDFAPVDGDRVLTTRDAYPPPEIPEHAIVIGSGVTGVEFTHLFQSLGSRGHAARVAPAGAADQGSRGRGGARGVVPRRRREAAEGCTRRVASTRDGDVVRCTATTDARSTGSHVLLAVGSIPNTEGIGLEDVGVVRRRARLHPGEPQLPVERRRTSTRPATCRASCRCRRWRRCRAARSPSTSWACTTGPHRHLDYDKAASAVFTDPEIADVGLAEAEAFSGGPQDPGHQGAVLVEREGAHQGRRRAAS